VKKIFTSLAALILAVSTLSQVGEARVNHRKVHAVKHIRRPPPPPPIVVANIDVSSQSMSVNVNGWPTGYWAVSTARPGYHTPRGSFRVQRMARVYFSKKYDNSPMPNSVFFSGGIAIHGSYHIRQLGTPASHGCVRLAPENAARLYELVEEYGAARTRITVTD
jgi:lipoprotein-anchoring transpeptidase ErfK/SrfK